MHLVLLAWLYVTLMMAVAEGLSPVGSWLGAFFTFVLYGVLPMAIVGYILNTPARRHARQRREAASDADAVMATPKQNSGIAPDADREASAAAIAPIRKEP